MNKSNQALRRVIALVMALLILLTSVDFSPIATVMAAAGGADSEDQGGGGHLPRVSGINMSSPGVFLGIKLVDNTGINYQAELQAHNAAGGTYWSECNASCVDQNLYNYPYEFMDTESVENMALVLTHQRNPSGRYLFMNDFGQYGKKTFNKVYGSVGKSSSGLGNLDIVRSRIKSDPAYFDAFCRSNLDYRLVRSLAQSVNISSEIDNFIGLFNNLGTWSDEVNNLFSDNPSMYYDNLLKYLDMLILVNAVCGETYWNQIASFLSNLNMDGANQFVVVYAMSAAVVVNPGGNKVVMSLPNFYGSISGRGNTDYTTFSYTGDTSNPIGDHGDGKDGDLSGFTQAMYDKYEGVAGKKYLPYPGLTSTNKELMWWTGNQGSAGGFSNWNAAVSLTPTDMNGKSTGNCGYTYFARFTTQPPEEQVLATALAADQAMQAPGGIDATDMPKFYITATNSPADLVKIPTGAQGAAEISIDLKQSRKARAVIYNMYTTQAARGYDLSVMDIFLSMEEEAGSGASANIIDTLIEPASASVIGGNQIQIPSVNKTMADKLFDGSQIIRFLDMEVPVSGPTTNKYIAKVMMSWGDASLGNVIHMEFVGKGRFTDQADRYMAYDLVSWVEEVNPSVSDSGHFYSTIRDGNYVEIKEGTPGNEHYEAMAGVPTTENLYVGFGATEFMMNMDTEYASSDGVRNYYFEKRFDKCYGNNAPCEYYCPGHTISGKSCSGKLSTNNCGKTAHTHGASCTPSQASCTQEEHLHSDSCKASCPGISNFTVYCLANAQSGTKTCPCGNTSLNWTWQAAKWNAGDTGKTCVGEDGSNCDSGVGCKVRGELCTNAHEGRTPATDGTHSVNKAHPGTHWFTGHVEQKVDEFHYLNITGLSLWRVDNLKYVYNQDLLDPFTNEWSLNTGYRIFADQDGYVSGNGRLAFSFRYDDNTTKNVVDPNLSHYGDTGEASPSNSELHSREECDQMATDDFNSLLVEGNAEMVETTVISDFVVLNTTEGYQMPTYNDQVAPKVTITSTVFLKGEDEKKLNGTPIMWNSDRTWDELWNHTGSNMSLPDTTPQSGGMGWSSFDWDPTHITRSGYNGKYDQPGSKWDNVNETFTFDPTEQWYPYMGQRHPGLRSGDTYVKGLTNWYSSGFSNLAMTQTGLNIIDSTTKPSDNQKGVWSATDSIDPVSNGEWITGNCYLHAKLYKYQNTGRPDIFSNDVGGDYMQEVGYTKGKGKVNDIVIHDPVSVEPAYVICNDSIYDDRTDESLKEGGDPPTQINGCPNNSTCQYQTLICTRSPEEHDDSCYEQIADTINHVGGNNTHVHNDSCYQVFSKIFESTGGYENLTLKPGTYLIELAGSASADGTSNLNERGCVLKGYININQETTLRYYLGRLGNGSRSIGEASNIYIGSNLLCSVAGGAPVMDTDISKFFEQYGYGQEALNRWLQKYQEAGVFTGDNDSGRLSDWHIETGGNSGIGYIRVKSVNVLDASVQKESYCGIVEWTTEVKHHTGAGGNNIGDWDEYKVQGVCESCGTVVYQYSTPNSVDFQNLYSVITYNPRYHKVIKSVHSSAEAKVTRCSNQLNAHICTSACLSGVKRVLTCVDPHHHKPGEPVDPDSRSWHYDYGDSRCWKACGDDSNHTRGPVITLPSGEEVSTADTFVNIDREFKVYYPDIGNFAQSPNMLGIFETTQVRGMGYTDGMNTSKWTRDKYLVLTIDVIDENNKVWHAGTPIDMYEVPNTNWVYTFYAPLENSEQMNGRAQFLSIAVNAAERSYYNENESDTNKARNAISYAAKHKAYKRQYVDVVGYIAGLTINDTGDPRFATLFKRIDADSTDWLIPNVVPRVNYKVPNLLVTDLTNSRHDSVESDTQWHDVWKTLYSDYGGKAYRNRRLPLTPEDNPITSLQNQPMRAGYDLLMDIQTAGNYYGENKDANGSYQDSNLAYRMQITPRYWALHVDTGVYEPVDAYMGFNDEYVLVNDFAGNAEIKEFYLYLDWLNESARRNYTAGEREATAIGRQYLSGFKEDGSPADVTARGPASNPDVLGTAQRLFLNDLDRTFVGSRYTYGEDKNPGDELYDPRYAFQAQRWHFTIGLPSSVVFVKHGQPCTDANIREIQDMDAVIVCSLDIKVKGEVWTLEYDGTPVNTADGGISIVPGGRKYPPPRDPVTNQPLKDPIVVVYSNKYTAKDDLRTEGTH